MNVKVKNNSLKTGNYYGTKITDNCLTHFSSWYSTCRIAKNWTKGTDDHIGFQSDYLIFMFMPVSRFILLCSNKLHGDNSPFFQYNLPWRQKRQEFTPFFLSKFHLKQNRTEKNFCIECWFLIQLCTLQLMTVKPTWSLFFHQSWGSVISYLHFANHWFRGVFHQLELSHGSLKCMASQRISQVLRTAALWLVACKALALAARFSICFHFCSISSLLNHATYENRYFWLLMGCIS